MLFHANFAAAIVLALTLSAYAAPSVGNGAETVKAALAAVQNTASGTAGTLPSQPNDSRTGSASSSPAGGNSPEPNAEAPPPTGGLPKRTPINVSGATADKDAKVHDTESTIRNHV